MAGGSSGPYGACFMIIFSVNGQPVKGLLDTGARRTVFPTSVISADHPATRKLCAYRGEEITTLSMANVRISGNGKTALVCCVVVPDGKLPLFGQDVIAELGLVLLAVVFGLKKFQQYVIGRHVSVFTDHRPLVGIVSKPFDSVPARVQRWLMALLPFDYQLQFIPGANMCTADALS